MTRPPVRGDDDWAPNDDDWADDEWTADEDADWYDEADPAAPAAASGQPAHAAGPVTYVEPEYEELSVEPPRRGRRIGILLAVVMVIFVVAVAAGAWFIRGRLDPSGPPGEAVRFTVPSGSSANSVATLLEEEGIIVDAQVFRWYLRFKGADGFLAGEYELQENMAAWDVLEVLRGDPLPMEVARFTVPEGLTLAEIPAAIVDDIPSFDAAAITALLNGGTVRPEALVSAGVTNLEGFLFPDTYDVQPGDGEQAALQRMATQFDAVVTELDLTNRAAALGRSPYEIITIASLIQEEYGIVEEMPKIARVIYNRLDVGEPLGIDATSRYEAVLAGRDREDLDFDSDSPYNTRRQQGLPPTPIALPGRAAIEAALAPADGPWIFYVRDPDASRTPPGGHFFTDSASEFAEVKDQCEAADLGCG